MRGTPDGQPDDRARPRAGSRARRDPVGQHRVHRQRGPGSARARRRRAPAAPRAQRRPSTKSIASVTMMSATRVTTIVRPVIAPTTSGARDDARARRAIASSKPMCSMYFARDDVDQRHQRADREVDPAADDHDRLGAAPRTQSGIASIASDWTSNEPPLHGRLASARAPRARRAARRCRPSSRGGARSARGRRDLPRRCASPRSSAHAAASSSTRPCIACSSVASSAAGARQLGGDLAAEERQHAVADERELGELAGEEAGSRRPSSASCAAARRSAASCRRRCRGSGRSRASSRSRRRASARSSPSAGCRRRAAATWRAARVSICSAVDRLAGRGAARRAC